MSLPLVFFFHSLTGPTFLQMVLPSALGVLLVTVLNILTSTRNNVINNAIRPGITSGGTTKLIQDTTTNSPRTTLYIYISRIQQQIHSPRKNYIHTFRIQHQIVLGQHFIHTFRIQQLIVLGQHYIYQDTTTNT